ncbi:hypothetical protein [Dysgonomonas termitidis]|uniref:Outer membrane protein beta-barrel domain-containing protein n=1 Tax=Dysgonomonas termitidis TaxID=1516126 RepID=A0ABV9L2R0_9BACT
MKKCILFISFLFMFFSTVYLSAQNSGRLVSRKVSSNITTENENYKNFRFTVGGGYAYWLGENLDAGNQAVKDFTSDLRHGYNLDIETQYYFHEFIGIGLNGSFTRYSSDDMKNINMRETDKMFFLGATCNGRYINNKWGFYSGLGFGPIFYSGDAEISGSYAKIEKTVFGINANIACEYRLSENVGTGLKLSVTAGSFEMYGVTDRMSVSSLMVTGFLSFRTK